MKTDEEFETGSTARRPAIMQRYGCPHCFVKRGEPCRGYKGRVRIALHLERWQLAGFWRSIPSRVTERFARQ